MRTIAVGPRQIVRPLGAMGTEAQMILAWLRRQQEAMSGLLAEMARAESPSVEPKSLQGMFSLLAAELEQLDFLVKRIPGRRVGDHLYARPRERRRAGPHQLLVGHMDTIWPLGTLERMPVRIEDDEVRGPGVLDMKGGLAQMVFALRALAETGAQLSVAPVVFVAGDEEVGSIESGRYLRPLARSAARAFVLEPAFGSHGMLKTARKGVGNFTVTVRGEAAHAGIAPEMGASAILELSHQIQRLFALNDPARGITVNVGTIDGGLRPNVVAPVASAVVDSRVPTLDAAREVEAAIRGLEPTTGDVSLEITGDFGRLPMERTARNRLLYERARVIGEEMSLPLDEASVGGASDGNTTSVYTATLDGLGSVGDGEHAEDERVIISAMPERAALLALLLMDPDEEQHG